MKSNKNLVLIGMMGSGKSTIGFLLSKKISLEFVDIDKYIENKEELKINEIFEKKGEKYFRKIEIDNTLKILNKKKTIISLGGGAFINEHIRKKILLDHISIWLNWSSSTIIKRIKNSKKRPLVKKISENQINKLIIERSKKYSLANYKLDCENLSKNEITKKIKEIYENH
tara:strand:+ start:276 stop:788 length:513 start_codon:yes stop_codon:yes gene_type:complete